MSYSTAPRREGFERATHSHNTSPQHKATAPPIASRADAEVDLCFPDKPTDRRTNGRQQLDIPRTHSALHCTVLYCTTQHTSVAHRSHREPYCSRTVQLTD